MSYSNPRDTTHATGPSLQCSFAAWAPASDTCQQSIRICNVIEDYTQGKCHYMPRAKRGRSPELETNMQTNKNVHPLYQLLVLFNSLWRAACAWSDLARCEHGVVSTAQSRQGYKSIDKATETGDKMAPV